MDGKRKIGKQRRSSEESFIMLLLPTSSSSMYAQYYFSNAPSTETRVSNTQRALAGNRWHTKELNCSTGLHRRTGFPSSGPPSISRSGTYDHYGPARSMWRMWMLSEAWITYVA